MPERPLLVFPTPAPAERIKKPAPVPRPTIPEHGKLIDRQRPMFATLVRNFREGLYSVSNSATGIEPEKALVIEINGGIRNFLSLCDQTEGIEFIADINLDEIEEDPDYPDVRQGKFILSMTNSRGLLNLLSLWNKFKKDENIQFPHGFTQWRKIFKQLKDIRFWGVKDRLLETGALDNWKFEIDEFGKETIQTEVELFFRRSPDKRNETENEIRALCEEIDGDVEAAINSYERGMERMEKPLTDNYESLISLYFVQNRYEDARDLAMKAIKEYPEETIFVQFLADTYLEIGETERAVELIRELIAENPDNPQYYFVLGTQLYRTAEEKLNAAGSCYDRIYQMEEQMSQLSSAERANLEGNIEELRAEAESLEAEGNEIAEMAVEEIKSSLELNPDDDYAYNVLGIIYQNKAAALFDKRNSTRDNELARQFDDETRENLRQAMEYYESAAELNPDETDYWQALFQVYTTLGMDEEANKIIGKIDQI